MSNAVFFANDEALLQRVFGGGRLDSVQTLANFYPIVIGEHNFERHVIDLADVEVIFSTWGMPSLSQTQITQLTALRAVFYAAGTVRPFAQTFLESGIRVFSAWHANAVAVAEYTLAQIILANKGYFRNICDYHDPQKDASSCYVGPGNFGTNVALLGAGQICRKLISLLKNFQLNVFVYDPYLTDIQAKDLGTTKVTLEEAFAEANVISNHMPNIPETRSILNGSLFRSMKHGSVFINTGRGAQIVEHEMIDALWQRPDLTALLDVTDPEPPMIGSPLFSMPNVYLSSHIAGSTGNEVIRMADYMIDEFLLWKSGKPTRYEITLQMLLSLA